MIEKLLIAESIPDLRRNIIDYVHRAADFLNKPIQVYGAQNLKRADDILKGGEISFLMTNIDLGVDGYEGILLSDYAILPNPKAPREKICVYSDTIPIPDILPGVIQVAIPNLTPQFIQAFINGLKTHPN